MAAEVITKEEILKLSELKLDKWLLMNEYRLTGSAIFTKNNSVGSKLVRWGEKHLFAKCKTDDCFTPSHTGSIIMRGAELCIFDMKPPRAAIQPLKRYLLTTDEDYRIVIRDFPLDPRMFSANCAYHDGEFYPYLSALRSVFTKRQSKWQTHCSELHLRELQKQGLFKGVNPEITPDELYHLFLGGAEC